MSNFASITYHVYTCMLYWYYSFTHCHHHNDVRLVKYIELEGFWKEMSILVVPIAACMYGTQCRDPTYYILFIEKNSDIDAYTLNYSKFMILVYACVWILHIILSILKFSLLPVTAFHKHAAVLICQIDHCHVHKVWV